MIPLSLSLSTDAQAPFVTRLRSGRERGLEPWDSVLVDGDEEGADFAGEHGLISIDGADAGDLDGDIVLVQPGPGRVERLIRAKSRHNTLLVTERCDQLCLMCSQPPKKTHDDRFDALEAACLLAPPDCLIGISGGEPTLYKERLLDMLEHVLEARPDMSFHVLSNAQHFAEADIERLASPLYRRVSWGIPLYAADPALHDRIVGKEGAFRRLEESFALLLRAGARIELRTVLVEPNLAALPALAGYVSVRLRWVEVWSIMQLENIGFARNRWHSLYVDHSRDFTPIAAALNLAALHGVSAQLFNFPRCTVPENYRRLAAPSISDWKRKYMPACAGCRQQDQCGGFFEWHPDARVSPL